MKVTRVDNPGEFDGKGNTKVPASMVITVSEMDREEYIRMDLFMNEDFPMPPKGDPVHLRKLVIVDKDPVHSGMNPIETVRAMK